MNKTCRVCWLFSFCLLFISIVSDGARRPRYQLKWHRFDCINNSSVITNFSCRIEKNGRVSSEYLLSEPVPVVWVKYKMIVKRAIQKTEMILFDSAFDACRLLCDGVMQNKLVIFVYQNMIRESNMAKQCPLNKGLLYFRNVAGLDQFPFFLPEMDFMLKLIFYTPNTTNVMDLSLKGSVIEQNRARNKFWHWTK